MDALTPLYELEQLICDLESTDPVKRARAAGKLSARVSDLSQLSKLRKVLVQSLVNGHAAA